MKDLFIIPECYIDTNLVIPSILMKPNKLKAFIAKTSFLGCQVSYSNAAVGKMGLPSCLRTSNLLKSRRKQDVLKPDHWSVRKTRRSRKKRAAAGGRDWFCRPAMRGGASIRRRVSERSENCFWMFGKVFPAHR